MSFRPFVVSVHGMYATARCTDGPGGTKCELCRAAYRRWFNQRMAMRQMMLAQDPSLAPHGNPNTYRSWGCRCRPCTTAATKLRYTYKMRGRRIRIEPFGRE